jgi:hypothetical protein
VDEPGGAEVADGALDRVARAEVLGARGDLAHQLAERDLVGVESEQLSQHHCLHGCVRLGGGADLVHLLHGHYIRAGEAELSPGIRSGGLLLVFFEHRPGPLRLHRPAVEVLGGALTCLSPSGRRASQPTRIWTW